MTPPQPPPGAPIGSIGPDWLSRDQEWCGEQEIGRSSFYPPLVR
jgi:hypothetical protein